MKDLDEILFDAITANVDLMTTVGNRVRSTCFEVGPDEQDNTPLPCVIVTDNGMNNQPETKDNFWEGQEDSVTAGIEVDGRSPKEVKKIIRQCRAAVHQHIRQLAEQGEDTPYLNSLQTTDLAWDWMKPCYHQTLIYQCSIPNLY